MRTIQQYRKDHPQLSEEQVHSAYHITEIDAPEFSVSGFTLIAPGKCLAIHEKRQYSPFTAQGKLLVSSCDIIPLDKFSKLVY